MSFHITYLLTLLLQAFFDHHAAKCEEERTSEIHCSRCFLLSSILIIQNSAIPSIKYQVTTDAISAQTQGDSISGHHARTAQQKEVIIDIYVRSSRQERLRGAQPVTKNERIYIITRDTAHSPTAVSTTPSYIQFRTRRFPLRQRQIPLPLQMTGYGGQLSLFATCTKLTIDRRLMVQQLSVSSPLICLFNVAISSS